MELVKELTQEELLSKIKKLHFGFEGWKHRFTTEPISMRRLTENIFTWYDYNPFLKRDGISQGFRIYVNIDTFQWRIGTEWDCTCDKDTLIDQRAVKRRALESCIAWKLLEAALITEEDGVKKKIKLIEQDHEIDALKGWNGGKFPGKQNFLIKDFRGLPDKWGHDGHLPNMHKRAIKELS